MVLKRSKREQAEFIIRGILGDNKPSNPTILINNFPNIMKVIFNELKKSEKSEEDSPNMDEFVEEFLNEIENKL